MAVPLWTLDVEDFGRVKSGQFELSSFNLLVGQNNTGKSYIASLLWYLFFPYRFIGDNAIDELSSRAEISEMADSIISGSKTAIEEGDWAFFERVFNELLNTASGRICKDVLGIPDVHYGRARMHAVHQRRRCDIKISPLSAHQNRNRLYPIRFNGGAIEIRFAEFDFANTEIKKRLVNHIALSLIRFYYSLAMTGYSLSHSSYIPAARTGLVLGFRTFMSGLLGRMEERETDTSAGRLSAPIINFLQEFDSSVGYPADDDGLGMRNDWELALQLEERALRGNLDADSSVDAPELYYRPNGTNLKLPMHASSSLVTELTPFVVFLKSGTLGQTVIFEEPEAHLHLSAQRAIARTLVRLANAGRRVIVTTHSDTFLQQINVLMHLHAHPKRQQIMTEYGYSEDELLSPDSARAYLFDDDGKSTVVRPLEKTREGFVEPVMNAEIAELTSEILRLAETDSTES